MTPDDIMRMMREFAALTTANAAAAQPAAPAKWATKGLEVTPFKGEGPKASEELERFKMALKLKFAAEGGRYPEDERVGYVFSKLDGRAAELCIIGVGEDRYSSWHEMIHDLDKAFGEWDPNFAWDEKLLTLKQGGKTFIDHVSEFRTLAQRSAFGTEGRGITSILRASLSSQLKAKIATEDVRGMSFGSVVELCLRHDIALRNGNNSRPWENRPWEKRSNYHGEQSKTKTQPAVVDSGWDPMDLERQKVREQAFKEGRCFKCNAKGHLAVGCKKPATTSMRQSTKVVEVEEGESEKE